MARERTIRNEWTTEEIDDVLAVYTPITIPVSVSIEGGQKVLSLKEAERILKRAKLISLEPCWCRLKLKNCDGPIDVCICVDREAELAIKERQGRKVTLEEAMTALRRTHKAGLVHLAYEMKGHEMRSICSCCACCCHTMAAITRFGYQGVVKFSDKVARHDPALCTDCMVCVGKCHFDAWGVVGGKVHHYPLKCAGCGVCVAFCPKGAIKLNARPRAKKRASGKPSEQVMKRMV